MAESSWYSRPLFISSTFKDMQAERDHLRDVVFPELERRLRDMRCHLEPIDLRWGVETVETPEQERKELLVLKVCLDEIERCRPFIIVLLGDRYGWTPPEKRMEAAVNEKGFKTDISGKSVTALEIEYGILKNPEQKRRCFFYFREGLPYTTMPDPALYSDEYSKVPGAKEAYKRLEELKSRIESDRELKPRVRRYRAEWQNGRVTGLDNFGKQALKDLWTELEEETRERAGKIDDTWQGQERRILDDFIESRTRDFVGRGKFLEELRNFALSPGKTAVYGCCVAGAAGSGKSAVFARLHRELDESQIKGACLILSHAAGISMRSDSVDAMIRRWIQELARHINPQAEDPSEKTERFEDRRKLFGELLSQVAAKTRVVILVDALNQFERMVIARYLQWLPDIFPHNARLIVTAIPGEETGCLDGKPGFTITAIPALKEEDREISAIIESLCQRYRKTLPKDIIREMVTKKLPDGSLAGGNPLWLSIAIQHLILLDEDDFSEADKLSGNPDEKIHAFMLQTARNFPAQIEELYNSLFRRACERFGHRVGVPWIAGMLDLIAASRLGLRESDLCAILGETYAAGKGAGEAKAFKERFELDFAVVRRYLRAQLTLRGEQGLWNSAHAQGRLCVRKGRLAGAEYYRKCHKNIVDYLERLNSNDWLRQNEIMYHYMQSDEKQRAAFYYGSIMTDGEVDMASGTLATAIAEGQAKEPNPGIQWAAGMLNQDVLKDALISRICNNFNFNLHNALVDTTVVRTRLALIEETKERLEELRRRAPDSADFARDLSVSYNKLGDLYLQLGEPPRALEYYNRGLVIHEELRRRAPDSAEYSRDMVVSYYKIASFHTNLKNTADAVKCWQLCKEALVNMKERGMYLDKPLEDLFEYLNKNI